MLVTSTSIGNTRPCTIYLTPDCTDGAVQKRVHSLISQGVDLISFSFRRTRYNLDFVPDWPNVELGTTTERRLFTRLFVFLRAARIIFGSRQTWRAACVLMARNLDLALLALLGKTLTGSRATFIYEVLDVHPKMTRPGIRGAFLRWLERRVLARCQLLVVSSPAFLNQYFLPVQRYQGKSYLLENKWSRQQISVLPRKLPYDLVGKEPRWTIGWFGNIRCPRSLEILTELADAMPQRVQIYIRGCLTLLGEQKLRDAIGNRQNMVFDGEYCAPGELSAIYSNIHFNWCIDLSDGMNSIWLLPNRIYEGGYFGVPALAVADHETGSVVRKRQLGISLASPLSENLAKLLTNMTSDEYEQLRGQVEALSETNFVDSGDLAQLIRTLSHKNDCYVATPSTPENHCDPVGKNH